MRRGIDNSKITVTEAAEIMGASPQYIRLALQVEKFPFGVAVKFKGRYVYYINKNRLEKYMLITSIKEGKDQ